MRPIVNAGRRRSSSIDVKSVPDVDARNVETHGNEFEESVQRIHDDSLDRDLFNDQFLRSDVA